MTSLMTRTLTRELCGWCDRPATVAAGTEDASCEAHTLENYALTRTLEPYRGAVPTRGKRARGTSLTARLTLARLNRKA
jgi:hypothetical protein